MLRNPDAVSLLARVNGEIAGFVIGMVERYGSSRHGHIYTIDVAVTYRRMGVGLRLLSEMENVFLDKGTETSYLEARADNEAAIRLYKKQGYVQSESLKNYYSRGAHGLRFTKHLKA